MNQNKSNGLPTEKDIKNHFEQAQSQKDYRQVFETLRFNAFTNPTIDVEQASDNHQLLQLDGMYFCQLGIGVVFEKHYAVEWCQRFPYWHSEIVLIKKTKGQYAPTFLRSASLLKPKIIKLVKQRLYESLEFCGDTTREEFITKKYGLVLLRPLLPKEFLKLPDYAKEYSDYDFTEHKAEEK